MILQYCDSTGKSEVYGTSFKSDHCRESIYYSSAVAQFIFLKLAILTQAKDLKNVCSKPYPYFFTMVFLKCCKPLPALMISRPSRMKKSENQIFTLPRFFLVMYFVIGQYNQSMLFFYLPISMSSNNGFYIMVVVGMTMAA